MDVLVQFIFSKILPQCSSWVSLSRQGPRADHKYICPPAGRSLSFTLQTHTRATSDTLFMCLPPSPLRRGVGACHSPHVTRILIDLTHSAGPYIWPTDTHNVACTKRFVIESTFSIKFSFSSKCQRIATSSPSLDCISGTLYFHVADKLSPTLLALRMLRLPLC